MAGGPLHPLGLGPVGLLRPSPRQGALGTRAGASSGVTGDVRVPDRHRPQGSLPSLPLGPGPTQTRLGGLLLSFGAFSYGILIAAPTLRANEGLADGGDRPSSGTSLSSQGILSSELGRLFAMDAVRLCLSGFPRLELAK